MPLTSEQNMINATTVMSETAAEIKTVITDTNVATAAMQAEKNAFVAAGVDTFMNKEPVEIGADVNLNTLTESGIYLQYNSNEVSIALNYPASLIWNNQPQAGKLIVSKSGAHVYHSYTFYKGETCTRMYDGAVWTNWIMFALESRKADGIDIELNLLALDPTKFYPVLIEGHSFYTNTIQISRQYSWGYGANPLMSVFLEYTFIGNTWGGNPVKTRVRQHNYSYSPAILLGYASRYKSCVFLRGGYLYKFRHSYKLATATIYEVETEYNLTGSGTGPNGGQQFGPITEAEALLHAGMLDADLYDQNWDFNITELGKTV